MAQTYTATVTIGIAGGGGVGYNRGSYGSTVPTPFNVDIDDGSSVETIEIPEIADLSGGIGIEVYFQDQSAPFNTLLVSHVTEIRLGYSGGTLVLDPAVDATFIDDGNIGNMYFFFGNHGGTWVAGDDGLDYTIEFDTNAPGGPAPPTPPDYNQGTKIVNPKNPGGGVPIPEAEYTTTQTAVVSQQQVKKGGGGGTGKGGGGGPPAEVIIDLPAQAGTFDLTPAIEGYDFGSNTWYPILTGANITAGGTKQRLKVSSTAADVANASANDVLPYMWRVQVVHGDATAVTYSVEYKL